MKNALHPYALIFGIGIGIVVLAALRHPLFALFAAIVATVGLDMAFKSGKIGNRKKKIDDDKKDE